MTDIDILEDVLSKLDSIQSDKESKRKKSKVDLRALTKCIYDFTKEQEEHKKTNTLPELIIQDFDEEQIWQQLELQNKNILTHLFIGTSKVLTNKQLTFPVSSIESEHKLVGTTNDELSHDDDDTSDDISDDILQDSEDEIELKSNLKKRKIKQKSKSSIVDDKFFKLEDLDEYLTKEERKEKRNNLESDDESVDLFNDFSEEEDEDNENRYVKYADFFDSPESENEQYKENESLGDNVDEEEGLENEDEMNEEDKKRKDKKVRFNLTNDSDETDSLDDKMNQEEQYMSENKKDPEENTEPQSNLELRQERVLQRIKELEEEAIREKPWQLKGEVSGLNRPQNSLLEEFVEFDVTRRPAPVITEETTIKLEDIIKQRIKDKTWDDVEKKFKPVETPLEYKKKLILDQEKSKESLSQIYEKEYLKQKQALNPEDNERKEEMPESHKRIQEKMHSLMNKLDALCNYHFTPKRSDPEIKIVTNMPAITMEEVTPVATSDAVLLAPEEVKAKPRGDLIGKAERTKTDMKRARRQKKLRQRAKQKMIEEKDRLNASRPSVAKKQKNKKEDIKLIKKLTKDRKITKMEETTQKVAKSSTAFFAKLQDQAKSKLKTKTVSKENKKALSAIKLKL